MPPPTDTPPRSPGRLARALDMARNMGPRYVAFRVLWELRRRSGLLKRSFPTVVERRDFTSLHEWQGRPEWQMLRGDVRERLPRLDEAAKEKLFAEAERILEGQVRFFGSTWYDLGADWDWRTHPETEYRYPDAHWTEIADFSARAGDIKFVWEKARFSWVFTLARAEAQGGPEAGAYVLGQIAHFIAHNPINCGPQYRCSQETSLRVLAWAFALSFWRHHPALTEELFGQIMHAVRWQLHHVRAAIHFSRIAVRNNHATTELMMLWLAKRLFPFLPEAAGWARDAHRWLEEEIAYQVQPEGPYIQHSMNYHRVLAQTMTLFLSPAGVGPGAVSKRFRQRAEASLDFLLACQDEATGWLPNYGNNDGALFFPLASAHFRDYRPALHALARALGRPSPYAAHGPWEEEAAWWRLEPGPLSPPPGAETRVWQGSGYASVKAGTTMTFLRAAAYADRPGQSDNLHLDLWHNGHNLLRDAGSYKYNVDEATQAHFAGAAAHNAPTLGRLDPMLKGPRFIWHYWPEKASLEVREGGLLLQAEAEGYRYLPGGPATVRRTVQIQPEALTWIVEDEAANLLGQPLCQHWHPAPGYEQVLEIAAVNTATGEVLEAVEEPGYYSGFYGRKQEAPHLVFSAASGRIRTVIRLKHALAPATLPDAPLDE